MDKSLSRAALVAVGAVLLISAEVPITGIRALGALLLCAALGLAAWQTSLRWWSLTPLGGLGLGLISIPTALVLSGFFLSLTRIGIRPDSVAPCIFACFLALVFLTPPGVDRPPAPTQQSRMSVSTTVLALAGLAVLVLAIVASVVSYRAWEGTYRFAALAVHRQEPGSVVVDVQNHEGSTQNYRVVIEINGAPPLVDSTVRLSDGVSTEVQSAVPTDAAIQVKLYHGSSNRTIRELAINPSAIAGGP